MEVTNEITQKMLSQNGQVRFLVTSDSMYPALRSGVQVMVEQFPANSYRKGDLLVFRLSGELVIHRLLEISPEGWCITKGDNAFFSDLPFKLEDILGRVVGISHGQVEIDMNKPGWQVLNAFMGWTGRIEKSFLASVNIHRSQPHHEPNQAETNPKEGSLKITKRNEMGLHLLRVLRTPYRLPLRFFFNRIFS
jgi:signal peptidase I